MEELTDILEQSQKLVTYSLSVVGFCSFHAREEEKITLTQKKSSSTHNTLGIQRQKLYSVLSLTVITFCHQSIIFFLFSIMFHHPGKIKTSLQAGKEKEKLRCSETCSEGNI